MSLQISLYGDAVLRKITPVVTSFDGDLKTLARLMVETLRKSDTGIGLAAPQVGKSVRLFIVNLGGPKDFEDVKDKESLECILDGKCLPIHLTFPLVVINPKITKTSIKTDTIDEGCLSLPGIHAKVSRPYAIALEYQDLEGTPHTLECSGMLSKCIQHEYDHLEGKLIIDYLPPALKDRIISKLYRIQRQEKSLRKHKS